ncbi:hypothetical protein [Mesorhizobium sp. LSHC412B00]|uniref:hypothetical protein n=1 Tax=Mesorhizobium sp. LSHC412B00 TaxID=1287285 RepID=UPI0003CE7633|nr:hypothetical protein [Mesorhizobium sp. LSHC412B00]ESX81726.1 hypothetical protein X756_31390 [Mesorhizobium sp. LSHC412B00]
MMGVLETPTKPRVALRRYASQPDKSVRLTAARTAPTAARMLSSRREKTTICKLNWTAAAAGFLLLIKDMTLIAAARALRMIECFFIAADSVTIAKSCVQVKPAILMRSVAPIRQIEAGPTESPVGFFDRSLAG